MHDYILCGGKEYQPTIEYRATSPKGRGESTSGIK